MSPELELSLFEACRTLFGPDLRPSREFLFYLQPEGAKAAFRNKAKQTHPDLFAHQEATHHRHHTERFQDLTRAYEILCDFLKDRDRFRGTARPRPYRPSPPPRPKREQPTQAKQRPNGTYYQGLFPSHPLELGHFLYYSGLIPYQSLIAALVWQRTQRPSIGQIARTWGWVNDSTLQKILTYRGPYCRFGQRAIRLGILSSFQVRTLLRYQRTLHRRIGEYFVEQGFLETEQIEKLVQDLHQHNARAYDSERFSRRTN